MFVYACKCNQMRRTCVCTKLRENPCNLFSTIENQAIRLEFPKPVIQHRVEADIGHFWADLFRNWLTLINRIVTDKREFNTPVFSSWCREQSVKVQSNVVSNYFQEISSKLAPCNLKHRTPFHLAGENPSVFILVRKNFPLLGALILDTSDQKSWPKWKVGRKFSQSTK